MFLRFLQLAGLIAFSCQRNVVYCTYRYGHHDP